MLHSTSERAAAAHIGLEEDDDSAPSTTSFAPCASSSVPIVSLAEGKEILSHASTSFSAESPVRLRSLRPLLKVVAVTVSGSSGSVDTHALLDDGSTATFIVAEVAAKIGVKGPEGHVHVDDIGGLNKNALVRYVDFYIKGRHTKEVQDPKRPRMTLDGDKKVRCLTVLSMAYLKIIDALANIIFGPARPTDEAIYRAKKEELKSEVILASQITSIIFTSHNTNRQKVKGVNTNMQTKVGTTDYNIHFMGNDYSIKRADIDAIWIAETKAQGLEYKNFQMDSEENWYGTMGPYLDMFAAFKLRMDELRLGHGTMPITKKDGTHTAFQVSKYGLTGAHHILLEGNSFPPERRSSIVQSLGPMTSFLCMIRTEGKYRNKFAAVVKRAMSHIPAIDDIIEITKNVKMSFELSTLISLIAEILLITTSRQATRMCFPLNFFA